MPEDKVIAQFLEDNTDKKLWQLILQNNMDEVLEMVSPVETKQTTFAQLFHKKNVPAEGNSLFSIVYELFKKGESPTLKKQQFEVMDTTSEILFKDVTRLLFALDLNDDHANLADMVSEKLFASVEPIAREIEKLSNGYPQNTISAQVWMGGAAMRAGFAYLIYYYDKYELKKSQLWVQKMRTIITLSIMGHYKNMVGPDMIAVAELEEELDIPDDALQRYKAVIADFENELPYFTDDNEAKPDHDDIDTLTSLLKSYKGVNRLEAPCMYDDQIEIINQIFARK